MKTLLITFALLGFSQPQGQAQTPDRIHLPWVGLAIDAAQSLHSIHGVAGNFIAGETVMNGVLAAACNAEFCLAKTNDGIFALSAGEPAWTAAAGVEMIPQGSAIFALGQQTAWIYFPEARSLMQLQNGVLSEEPTPQIDGEVLALRLRNGALEFAVRRAQQTWVVRPDGAIIDTLPGETGPVLLLDHAAICTTDQALAVRQADGSEIRLTLPAVVSLTSVGPHYAQVVVESGARYLLRTDTGREELFLLPLPAAEPSLEERRKPAVPDTLRRSQREGPPR